MSKYAFFIKQKICETFLGGTADSDFAFCVRCSVRWSVCPSVYLSHLCTLLKPLDVMRYRLAGTLLWSQVTLH